jgi:pimeloyl-ACP methyl ester carboxylesterase
MAQKKQNTQETIADMQQFIKPLNMNGLQGRMLRMPAKKGPKREILLLYGHHASIERMFGIAEALNDFGTVTLPDLPGFGGMSSFYSIGMKPSIDNMADYLASFIKLRYRGKKVTIMGMSLGFVFATRMLQRYPEIVKKVDLLVSIVGFSHHHDFILPKNRQRFYRYGASFFSNNLPAKFFYNVALHPTAIRKAYAGTYNARKKLGHLSEEERKAALDFEVELWRNSDLRTYMDTTITMFTLNNCQKQIKLPVHHIAIDSDQYFDNSVVEQHMRVIFDDYIEHTAVLPSHAPSIIATKKDASPMFPDSFKKVLRKKS